MSDKQYLSADQLLVSFRLAERVYSSGFKPTMIIAIWRGGVPIGIAVQEFLAYCGIETDHIAIRTSSYDAGIDQRLGGIRVHGLNYLIKNVTAEDKLLIVDDVFDTGRTVDAVIERLTSLARLNTPSDIRVAVPYYKPSRRDTDRRRPASSLKRRVALAHVPPLTGGPVGGGDPRAQARALRDY